MDYLILCALLTNAFVQLTLAEEVPPGISCPPELYLTEEGKCYPPVGLKEKCHFNGQCRALDGNSICLRSSSPSCECIEGTVLSPSTGHCTALRSCSALSLNYEMKPSDDCGVHAYCRLRICLCTPGFIRLSDGGSCVRPKIEDLDFQTIIQRAAKAPEIRTPEDEGKNMEIINARFESIGGTQQVTFALIGLLLLLNILTMTTLICIRLRRRVYRRAIRKTADGTIQNDAIVRCDAYSQVPSEERTDSRAIKQPPPYDSL